MLSFQILDKSERCKAMRTTEQIRVKESKQTIIELNLFNRQNKIKTNMYEWLPNRCCLTLSPTD